MRIDHETVSDTWKIWYATSRVLVRIRRERAPYSISGLIDAQRNPVYGGHGVVVSAWGTVTP